ncbi:MAG: FKBP-type peptidyl-prolyl cis-trans isomerase [Solobacterium sp.]|nr:FKBP-type peptidyl-prolyl cis-trans isomerase [Solobacterium sp.]
MKLAVSYDNGEVFQHFGKTEAFKLYEIENRKIVSSLVTDTAGTGHSALASFLSSKGVQTVICGGIGEGARNALSNEGIQVIAGAEGNADDAVASYLNGTLVSSEESCNHHHEDGHSCGEHAESEHCGGASGCGGCGGCGGELKIEPIGKNAGHTCRVHYRGTFNDGTQFDSSYDRGTPIEFVCGAGMMIRGFDKAVADMEPGQKTTVHLMPEEAYGVADPAAIMVIPFKDLPGSEDLTVGEQVILADEYGRRFRVTVREKNDSAVTLDANHEMAGKELNFEIELIEIR